MKKQQQKALSETESVCGMVCVCVLVHVRLTVCSKEEGSRVFASTSRALGGVA